MLDNLLFSLNATMPLFLMMVVGYTLKKIGLLDAHTTNVINKLVFKVFLPCLLFMDVADQDFAAMWDTTFVVFCLLVTIASIGVSFLLSLTCHDRSDRGEFVQASYRSAAATLGIAFMTNIYDNVAMVALMMLACVPLYNIIAVILLSLTSPDKQGMSRSALAKKTIHDVLTNPIILGILAGLLWSVAKLPLPAVFSRSVTYLGNCASPLALVGLGACFAFGDLQAKIKETACIVFNKLFLWPILFLPLAVYLSFRDEKLVAALIMLGSSTTSSSFIMAKNMGHKGVLSSCAVMLTTLLSAFSLTLWLFVLRTFGYI